MTRPAIPSRLPAGATPEGDGILVGSGPVRIDAYSTSCVRTAGSSSFPRRPRWPRSWPPGKPASRTTR